MFYINQCQSLAVPQMIKCGHTNVQEIFHLPIITLNKTCLLVKQECSYLKNICSKERIVRNFQFKI